VSASLPEPDQQSDQQPPAAGDEERREPSQQPSDLNGADGSTPAHGELAPARPYDPAGTQPKLQPPVERPLPIPLPAQPQLAAGTAVPATVENGGERLPGAASRIETPAASRVHFMLGVLIALAAVAIAAIVVIVTRPVAKPPPIWSAWAPTSKTATSAVSEIAQHVGSEYHFADGNQLAAVTGGPFQVQGLPFSVALPSPSGSGSGSNVTVLSGNGVMYQLCGLGPGCSLAEGKASTQRGLLLGREALELALYTFHYVSGINQVAVTIPPPRSVVTAAQSTTASSSSSSSSTAAANRVFFFRAGQLTPEVDHPLYSTLSRKTPNATNVTRSADAPRVGHLVNNLIYSFSFVQQPDTSVLMVLSHL
jgi:hypothetical protein